jgi:polyisoprenoid-binding protein YceI
MPAEPFVRRIPLFALVIAAHLTQIFAPPARAEEFSLQLDPVNTKIEFTLGATLHTVHGSFALSKSIIHFDSAAGRASGEIVADATTGDTGNAGRDRKMHREILESDKFPDVVFIPEMVRGTLAPEGSSDVEVAGRFRLHGQEHPMTVQVHIEREGRQFTLAAHITIPYIQWGLKNPSTFMLRVSDKVEMNIHAAGQIIESGASRP